MPFPIDSMDFTTIAIVGGLILAGLLCCWISLQNLARLDQIPAVAVQQPEKKAPRLTRLGRPVKEVQIQG